MRSCDASHTLCKTSEVSRLPDRVLYVGNIDHVFVLEHSQELAPYLALSHCWGTRQILKTETRNLVDHLREIPWAKLPKTFQDAIYVTRRLGYQHLWIDSLCIVQDDLKDWREQSAKMGQIYQGARLVLAASAAQDGSAGLFTPRKPSNLITGLDILQASFKVYVRETISHHIHSWGDEESPNGYLADTTRGKLAMRTSFPLMTRAWCYQERLLGRRVLHYESGELVWECLTCSNCECGAMSDARNNQTTLLRRAASEIISDPTVSLEEEIALKEFIGIRTGEDWLAKDISDVRKWLRTTNTALGWHVEKINGPYADLIRKYRYLPEDKHALVLDLWRTVVSEYSARDLTYTSDTLPALSGLASKWQTQATGKYLAGVWEHDLLRSCLWRSHHDESERSIPQYICPSWSWASCRKRISWVSRSKQNAFEWCTTIISHHCELRADHQPFGQVLSGHIKVIGPLIDATLERVQQEEQSLSAFLKVEFPVLSSQRLCFFYGDRYDVLQGHIGGTVHLLHLGREQMSGSHFEHGLVLCRVQEADKTYRRIGYMLIEQPLEDWGTIAVKQEFLLV